MKMRIEIDDFIRISFPYAPKEAIRTAVKRNGYRWYPNGFFWGKRNSPQAVAELTEFINEFFPDKESVIGADKILDFNRLSSVRTFIPNGQVLSESEIEKLFPLVEKAKNPPKAQGETVKFRYYSKDNGYEFYVTNYNERTGKVCGYGTNTENGITLLIQKVIDDYLLSDHTKAEAGKYFLDTDFKEIDEKQFYDQKVSEQLAFWNKEPEKTLTNVDGEIYNEEERRDENADISARPISEIDQSDESDGNRSAVGGTDEILSQNLPAGGLGTDAGETAERLRAAGNGTSVNENPSPEESLPEKKTGTVRADEGVSGEPQNQTFEKTQPTEQNETASGGKKEIKRIREQAEAILAKSGEPTSEEKAILERYEGAGGLKDKTASASGILSEFYTPTAIIDRVWTLADAYAPEAVTVLEPSAGTGRFAKNRTNNRFTFYEINPQAAEIAGKLYPNARIINRAFQSQYFDETGRVRKKSYTPPQYDLVIGNPPYGVYSGKWKGMGEGSEHSRYEEYFIDRGLDSLKDGGVLAFVVPSGFLRGGKDKIKEKIAQKGKLIDAWRLPNGAFPTTDVGTDIILIRKEKGDVRDFCDNHWFLKNRDKILGEEVLRQGRFGEEWQVRLAQGETLERLLEKIVPDSGEKVYIQGNLFAGLDLETPRRQEEQPPQRPAATAAKTSSGETRPSQAKAVKEEQPVSPREREQSENILLTSEMFCRKYGKNFNAYEKEIWLATAYDGIVGLDGLSKPAFEYLYSGQSDYIEERPSRWIHKELYASGNIGEKLAELELNKNRSVVPDDLYEKNKALLLSRLPRRIPLTEISFSPQTSLAKEFISETPFGNLKLVDAFRLWATGENVSERSLQNGYFGYQIDFTVSPLKREDFPPEIGWSDVVYYLNGYPVKAERRYNEEGRKAAALEAEKKRIARRETADRLFNRFLHEGGLSDRDAERLENEWNRRFNSYVAPDWAKLPLYVEGMSAGKGAGVKEFTLYEQQLKGISFLCNKGNGLLAYDVGVGKTAAGIVSTVNQIQSGRSQRPLIVVPKAVYTKWLTDFKELFPNIKLNDLGNFSKENLLPYQNGGFGLSIEPGSVSVCTNEALQRISFKDETIETSFMEDFSNLLGIDDDIKNDRERALAVEKISKEIGTAVQAKDGFVFFEECGFDHLTVDEAHRFKNLYRVPRGKERGKSNEYAGLGSGTPSARALKLFAMTQYVQRENNDRNVFLLTATPFTNSPLEVYSMLSYMARKKMKEMHIYDIKDFLNEYAEMKTEWAVTPKGEIQSKQVMKNFRSLRSLQKFLGEYIDKVDADEAGVLRPRKITHVQDLNPTELQKKIIAAETARMSDPKEIKNGGVLVAMNNMRMAMLSPALLNPGDYAFKLPPLSELVESSPKLKFVCDTVADCHKEVPDGGQVIYMPRGVKEAEIVRDYLVKKWIPSEAIGFLNASVSKTKKESVIAAFNDKNNPLKIIIGSETISEGVDLNGNSFALYNTMLGWNPTETVQVEGRIWRQGNAQGHCHIVYPLMNDSIDSLMYQKHDEKSSRIDALWSYKGDRLNVEDISPEELKFDLIKDPMVKAQFVVDRQIGDVSRDYMICEGKIRTINEVKTKMWDLETDIKYHPEVRHYKDRYNKTIDKLGSLGVDTENRDSDALTQSIRKRCDELEKESRGLAKQMEEIRATVPAIAEQFALQEQQRQAALPPNHEIQKQLSQSILTNLKDFSEIKHELKKEMEEKRGVRNTEKTLNLSERLIEKIRKNKEQRSSIENIAL